MDADEFEPDEEWDKSESLRNRVAQYKKHILQGKSPADFFNPPPVESFPGLSPQFSAYRVNHKQTAASARQQKKVETKSNKRGAKYRASLPFSVFLPRDKSPILQSLKFKV
jgi:hypothetical protein